MHQMKCKVYFSNSHLQNISCLGVYRHYIGLMQQEFEEACLEKFQCWERGGGGCESFKLIGP